MRDGHTTLELLLPESNAFEDMLLRLELPSDKPADSFSKAIAEICERRDIHTPDYRLTQVFEPSVLEEVALLRSVDPAAAASLDYAPSARMENLAAEVAAIGDRNAAQLISLAYLLVSISRFTLAGKVLEAARTRTRSEWDDFELAFLAFVIDNRGVGGANSVTHFGEIRRAAESKKVPPNSLLGACTQAIVWFLKGCGPDGSDLRWFVNKGSELVADRNTSVSAGARSSWYRGIAMLPARFGGVTKTRVLMRQAREEARSVLESSDHASDVHLLKTYLESTLKEHMYVNPDLAVAEKTGHELIALDPQWGPSWAELGEAYARFGKANEAAEAFDNAVRLGSPWVRYSLRAAGDLYRELNRPDLALSRYYALTLFPNVPASVIDVTASLAKLVAPELLDELEEVRAEQGRLTGLTS